jgi:hypothetical protein
MPGKMRKKTDLPSKICIVCNLPFLWRKKWERSWDEVKYCSERCKRNKSSASNTQV